MPSGRAVRMPEGEADGSGADKQRRKSSGGQHECGAAEISQPPAQLEINRPGQVDRDLAGLHRSAISVHITIAIGAKNAWPSQT
jgi:hypothetical protein